SFSWRCPWFKQAWPPEPTSAALSNDYGVNLSETRALISGPEFQQCSIVSHSPKCGRPAPPRALIYCSDYRCLHSLVMCGKRWSDDVGHLRAAEEVPEVKGPCQRGGAPGARGGVGLALPGLHGGAAQMETVSRRLQSR